MFNEQTGKQNFEESTNMTNVIIILFFIFLFKSKSIICFISLSSAQLNEKFYLEMLIHKKNEKFLKY